MSRAWRDNLRRAEESLKYNERQSQRTRMQMDTLPRLYVKDPTIKTMKFITDVDPEYFSLVEGRPVTRKTNMKEYTQRLRDVLMTKIMVGYREDDIMLIGNATNILSI